MSSSSSGSAPIERELVLEQLKRITGSGTFRSMGRYKRVLKFLVTETLDERADGLKDVVIAAKFYEGKEGSWRTEARRLRQKLEEYYRSEGKPDPVLIAIPTGRYVPEFSPLIQELPAPSPPEPPADPAPSPWRIRLLLTSRDRWHRWPLVAKAIYISAFLSVLSLVVGAISFLPRWSRSNVTGQTAISAMPPPRIGISLSRLQINKADNNTTKRSIEHPHPGNDKTEILEWVPSKTQSGFDISAGDRVRFAIDSEVRGYVYVIDREIYSDHSLGDGVLIFPTARIQNGKNEIGPGLGISLPSSTDDPPFLEVKNHGRLHVGEQVIVLLARKPLTDFKAGGEPLVVSQRTAETLLSNSTQATLLDEHKGKAGQSGVVGDSTPARPSDGERILGQNLAQLVYAVPSEWTSTIAVALNLMFRRSE